MPFTEDFYLPSEEELTVEEVNISTPSLKAGAIHFGKYCDEQSKEFMLCRREEKDPRKCLNEGKEVTACAMDFFRKVKKTCREPFEAYASCLEWKSCDLHLRHCRKTQAALDECMLEKLDIERPHIGYFTEIRTHNSKRPKPVHPHKEYPDPVPSLPDDYPREPAAHGSRFYFFH